MYSAFEIFTLVSMLVKILTVIIFFIVQRKLYFLSFKLPGPINLPTFGNLYLFIFKKGSFLKRCNEIVGANKENFRFWFGTKLLVVFRKLETVEIVLNSTSFLKEGPTSMLQNCCPAERTTDERWRLHKKLVKPLINVKFVIDNIETFQKHISACKVLLDEHLDKEAIDIFKYIRLCSVDIFGEILLGVNMAAQTGKNAEFIDAIDTVRKNINKEIFSSWFYLGILYKCSTYHKNTSRARETQMYFIDNAIRKSWERRKVDVFGENRTSDVQRTNPIVDKIADFIESNPYVFKNEEFRDALLSLFVASEGGVSKITSFCCLCLGLFPEYQDKAVEEIKTTFTENSNFRYEDLYKLKYLEMVILEATRLVGTKAFIMKNFEEEFVIDNLKIPPACTIIIPAYYMHRDPEAYEKPLEFYPEHFLPDSIKKRKPCANLSFGFGARECIGKNLAMVGVKIFLVNILQKYRIETDGKFADINLNLDSTPTQGYKVRLKPRN